MRFDNEYGEQKRGGKPLLSVSEAILTDDERAYFGLCASDGKNEADKLKKEIANFYAKLLAAREDAETQKKRYSELVSELRSVTEKHALLMRGDTIWHTSCDEAEKKKFLRAFYDYCGSASLISEKLSAAVCSMISSSPEEWTMRSEDLKKRLFIAELAGLEVDGETARNAEKKLSELLGLRNEMFLKHSRVENAAGTLLSTLDSALDVKNKGENMDVQAALRAENAFISSIV